MLTAVVLRTPVGNPDLWSSPAPKGYVGGRLRASWNVSLVTADTSTSDAIDNDGGSTINRGTGVIQGRTGEQDIYLTNSLPYAIPVEYGHSGVQAPQGMVRVTVAEFQDFVSKAAAEVNT